MISSDSGGERRHTRPARMAALLDAAPMAPLLDGRGGLPVGFVAGGRYEVERLIARGGMASVYQALDRWSRRAVALKAFDRVAGEDAELAARFDREARIGAMGLGGVPAVRAHLAARAGEHPALLVMELIEGRTLASAFGVQRGHSSGRPALDVRAVLRVGREIAEVMAGAHARGIVHRDLKPSNIMLSARGGVFVIDFGIAFVVGDTTLTQTGAVMGTVAFMAPEQLCAERRPDLRTDVYGLGATLFECLTGQPLVPAHCSAPQALAQLERRAVKRDPVPELLSAGVPAEVAAMIRKATALVPADRFDDMTAMRIAIEECLGPRHTWPAPAGRGGERAPWRRWWWAVAAAAAGAVSVAAILATAVGHHGREAGPVRESTPGGAAWWPTPAPFERPAPLVGEGLVIAEAPPASPSPPPAKGTLPKTQLSKKPPVAWQPRKVHEGHRWGLKRVAE